ncbi:MAG TPA: hypothetical protein VHN77_09405 [Phycisphaerales bacterium]|nr:hypothetical protein [Phycisphaerales bacterium]
MRSRSEQAGGDTCAQQRAAVEVMARKDPEAALQWAKKIALPWYRVQAMASVIESLNNGARAKVVAKMAMSAADSDTDAYRGGGCLSWVVGACISQGNKELAAEVLSHALQRAISAQPASARADALQLLLRFGSDLGLKSCRPVVLALHGCILELATVGDRGCRYKASRAFDCLLIHTKPMDPGLAWQLVQVCEEPRVRAKAEKMFAALA